MDVVVAGDDTMATRLAEALMEEHAVVVLGPEQGLAHGLEQLDVDHAFGSITSPHILEEIGIAKVGTFIACSSNDETNIVACLAAKRLGAGKAICILNGPGFLRTEDDDDLAGALGIDLVIRPAEQLAEEIVRIVTVPGALDVEVFHGGRIALLRMAVEEDGPVTLGPLSSAKLPREVNLVGARRGEQMIIPKGSTRLAAGDRVIAMGRWEPLLKVIDQLGPSHADEGKQAAVIGAGTVGVAVARRLDAAGWRVKLLESDMARCEQVAEELDCLVLHGDGADLRLLEEERIGDMPVVVAVTNNDEKNLLISLLTKQLGAARIITRADKHTNEIMFERVGIDVVRSSRGAAIRSVVRHTQQSDVEIRAVLEHGEASIIEVTLPHSFDERRVRDIRPPEDAVIGAIVRREKPIIPGGNDTLEPYDKLLVFCHHGAEEATRKFFTETAVHVSPESRV